MSAARKPAFSYMALAVLAALVVNGLIFGLGLNAQDDTFNRVWFAPPGWLVGCVWLVLYAFYGIAYARAINYSAAGRAQSRWLLGLIIWGLLYPVTSGGFMPLTAQLANCVSLLFSLFVYWRIRRTAPPASIWLLPSLFWIGFATVWGAVALGGL